MIKKIILMLCMALLLLSGCGKESDDKEESNIKSIKITPNVVLNLSSLNEELQLSVTLTYNDGTEKKLESLNELEWNSSLPDIVSVNSTGKITGMKSGTAVISAEKDGVKGSINVTVDSDILFCENDYIETDDSSVKLMFKAAAGSKVEVYFGNTKESLQLFKTVESYNNEEIKFENLQNGQKYYYQLKVSKDSVKEDTGAMEIEKVYNSQVVKATPQWVKNKVFYEIFVRSFYDGDGDGIGDLKGIEYKLDYIKSLGVDAIWLTPIYPTPSYHGYNISDYYSVNPDFGTLQDFKNLVSEAHKRDLKVVIDFVANHTSKNNEWFQKFLNEDSYFKDFYRYGYNQPNGSWGMVGGNGSKQKYCYYAFGPQSDMPDLNYNNPKVRKTMKEVAKYWIDMGIDGLRLDVAQYIGDEDKEMTYRWWQEFDNYVKSINENIYVVGEVNADSIDDYKTHAHFYKGMDSTFDFPLYSQIMPMATGYNIDIIENLNKAMAEYSQYKSDFLQAVPLGNHDRSRFASELLDLSGDSSFSMEKIKKAINLQMTLPGIPYIYYGDEICMKGGHDFQGDPNKREPFDWYKTGNGLGMVYMDSKVYGASAKNIIADDGVSYEEQKDNPESILNYYKKMIKIRKENDVITSGKYERFSLTGDNEYKTYCYKIYDNSKDYTLYVIHNQDLHNSITLKSKENGVEELIKGSEYSSSDYIKIPVFGTVILKCSSQQVPVEMSSEVQKFEPYNCKLTIRVHTPEDTPLNSMLYMPSSIFGADGWNASAVTINKEQTCKKVSENLYEISVERTSGTRMEYKFFRGSWENSETDENGNWTGNRLYLFSEKEKTVDVYIKGWRDVDYKGD